MSNLTIGISTGIKNAQMSPGEIPCAVLSAEFIKLCNKFNAQAVIFPPQFNTPNFAELIISLTTILESTDKR